MDACHLQGCMSCEWIVKKLILLNLIYKFDIIQSKSEQLF